MGDVKKILITGAAGFIGRAAVAEARSRGIEVVAVVRSGPPRAWANDAGITLYRCDLSDPDTTALTAALADVDAVIHAAAHPGGDAAQHAADSARGTQTLLVAMSGARARTLVLVSSIGVYDTMQLPIGGTLTEACPLEHPDTARDAYVRGKLVQEQLCVDAARTQGLTLWRLRPGAVFGPGRLWNGHLGVRLGPVLVRVGGSGQVPVCHVARCGWALVQAAVTPGGGALNILDDDLPDRARFLAALRRSGWPRATIPMPWQLLMPLAKLLNRPTLPGLLREPVLRARMTPLSYSNRAMRKALGGRQARPFEVLMGKAIAEGSQ